MITITLTRAQFDTIFHALYMQAHDALGGSHNYSALVYFQQAEDLARQTGDLKRLDQCGAIISLVLSRIAEAEAKEAAAA